MIMLRKYGKEKKRKRKKKKRKEKETDKNLLGEQRGLK